MKTMKTGILILLIPLLLVAAISDAVDQDGFALQSRPVITSLDDVSLQYDRQHSCPAIHSSLQSEELVRPVCAPLWNVRPSTAPSLPALSFLLRAPPLC